MFNPLWCNGIIISFWNKLNLLCIYWQSLILMVTLQGGEGCWNHFLVEKSPGELRQQNIMWATGAGHCHCGEDWGGGGENQGDSDKHGLKLQHPSYGCSIRSSPCVYSLSFHWHTSLYVLYFCVTRFPLSGEEEHQESPCDSQASPSLQGECNLFGFTAGEGNLISFLLHSLQCIWLTSAV